MDAAAFSTALDIPKREFSSTARVSRVDTKYAYLANEKLGCIFVPPCAVLPPNCPMPDLTNYLREGDVVHFVAKPQQGRNDCRWLATKVIVSSKNVCYQQSGDAVTDKHQIVTVNLVTETFVYASNEELGPVFVPGAAFPRTEVSKLDTYLSRGDKVFIAVRPQAQRSGCSWIACTATKVSSPIPTSSSDLQQPSIQNTEIPLVSSSIEGNGIVISVCKDVAHAQMDNGNILVCPILTWLGGNCGNLMAEGLDDVVAVGTKVFFLAINVNNFWRARYWTSEEHWIGGPTSSAGSILCDSHTQTALSPYQMLLRALDPETLGCLRKKVPTITRFIELM